MLGAHFGRCCVVLYIKDIENYPGFMPTLWADKRDKMDK